MNTSVETALPGKSWTLPGKSWIAEASVAGHMLASARFLLDSVSVPVLLTDPSGYVRMANRAASAMIGASPDQLSGLDCRLLLEAAPAHESHLMSQTPHGQEPDRYFERFDGQDMRVERADLRCSDETRLPVKVDFRAIRDVAGAVCGHTVTLTELSDKLQMAACVDHLLHYDGPTGLPKKEVLARWVEFWADHQRKTGIPFALITIDVDDFARVNESLSHRRGDDFLARIASRLVDKLGEREFITRSGGDRFSILLSHCADVPTLERRAHELMAVFSRPLQGDAYSVKITASMGVALADAERDTDGGIIAEAEIALLRSKKLGGNRVTVFGPDLAEVQQPPAVVMDEEIRRGMARNEFYNLYQPQVCLTTGKLIGVEALMRWNSSVMGAVMPDKFIPQAEESGIIVDLGAWCLRVACREIAIMQAKLGHPIRLAANVSPRQVLDAGFFETVKGALQESGLPPHSLELEITEGLLMEDSDEAIRVLSALQALGITISVDDFGTGFANLSYIMRFSVNRLKIDRSFVKRCTEDRNSLMITTSITSLAHVLGLEVVAEGIETEDQASVLRKLRCDLAQGYLYARPLTLDKLHTFAVERPATDAVEEKAHQPSSLSPSAESAVRKISAQLLEDQAASALRHSYIEHATASAKPNKPAAAADVTPAPSPVSEAAPPSRPRSKRPEMTPVEPRDPLCRPVYPQRPVRARVRQWNLGEDKDAAAAPTEPRSVA